MGSVRSRAYFPTLWHLAAYRLTAASNSLRFGGPRSRVWAVTVLTLISIFFWLDYLFFLKLITAVQVRLEFLAAFMLQQLIHTLFLSFFGLLALSAMTSAISGYYLSREIPFFLVSPVSPPAFITQRFLLVFFQSAWMIFVFGTPPFLAYCVKLELGVRFMAGWLPVFILLTLIPVILGSCMAILLMRYLPASRVHQALTFISLAAGALIIILFRMSRPERLFMDVPTEEVMDFVKAMSVPESPFMPTSWATRAVVSLSSPSLSGDYLMNLGKLAATCAACILVFYLFYRFLYFRGFSFAGEGSTLKKGRGQTRAETAASKLSPVTGAYLAKDYLVFIRDPARWTQLFLLAALVVLYVYNARYFPMGGFFYNNLVAFLNLALSGFVISALCVRFVFPAVSLEGQSIWITLTAPVSMKKIFLAKFLFAALPIVLVSLVLTTATNLVMGVDPYLMALFGLVSAVMAVALVGLNLGLGAVFPRFNYENEAQIPASGGGVATMIISLVYVGSIVVFLAAPVYRFFAAPMGMTALTGADSAFGIAGAVIVSVLVAALPMVWGVGRIESAEY